MKSTIRSAVLALVARLLGRRSLPTINQSGEELLAQGRRQPLTGRHLQRDLDVSRQFIASRRRASSSYASVAPDGGFPTL
jgi:hypothetical protein